MPLALTGWQPKRGDVGNCGKRAHARRPLKLVLIELKNDYECKIDRLATTYLIMCTGKIEFIQYASNYCTSFVLISGSLLMTSSPIPGRHILTTVLSCLGYYLHMLPLHMACRETHVTEGLAMDIMHDTLEGSLQDEVKELLKHLAPSRLITLDQVNEAIQSFPYGYSDIADKPCLTASITLDSEDNHLKQSGIGRKLVCNNFNSAISPCL